MRTKAYDLAQSLQNTNPHAEIKIAGDNVYMDNELIHDPVQPPTPDTNIHLDRADIWNVSRLRFFTSDIISEHKSDFQMYSTEVCTIQEACLAFKAIGLEPTASSSTHLISAYWLSDGTYGYQDDRDHGMGKHLLSIMQESQLTNTICFLRREYGGVHLGYRRFDIIAELIDNIYEQVQVGCQPTCLNILGNQCYPQGNPVDIFNQLNTMEDNMRESHSDRQFPPRTQ
jgi:hypothetical protein